MTPTLADHELAIARVLASAARGPKRNGLFAVWLLVRACSGFLSPEPLSERAHRRRMRAFRKRISSLSMPPSLRRAIAAAATALEAGSPHDAAEALEQVTDVARDALGQQAATAVAGAADLLRAGPRDPAGAP